MSKAKTASKTNPTREKNAGQKKFFNGEEIFPVLYIDETRQYMAGADKNKELVTDRFGNVINWKASPTAAPAA